VFQLRQRRNGWGGPWALPLDDHGARLVAAMAALVPSLEKPQPGHASKRQALSNPTNSQHQISPGLAGQVQPEPMWKWATRHSCHLIYTFVRTSGQFKRLDQSGQEANAKRPPIDGSISQSPRGRSQRSSSATHQLTQPPTTGAVERCCRSSRFQPDLEDARAMTEGIPGDVDGNPVLLNTLDASLAKPLERCLAALLLFFSLRSPRSIAPDCDGFTS